MLYFYRYIFAGLGSHAHGMGKDLMVVETFKQTILRCHQAIEAVDKDFNLLDLIMNGTKESFKNSTVSFVSIASIQVSYCVLYLRWANHARKLMVPN